MSEESFKNKYLKYKNKYIHLKKQLGGGYTSEIAAAEESLKDASEKAMQAAENVQNALDAADRENTTPNSHAIITLRTRSILSKTDAVRLEADYITLLYETIKKDIEKPSDISVSMNEFTKLATKELKTVMKKVKVLKTNIDILNENITSLKSILEIDSIRLSQDEPMRAVVAIANQTIETALHEATIKKDLAEKVDLEANTLKINIKAKEKERIANITEKVRQDTENQRLKTEETNRVIALRVAQARIQSDADAEADTDTDTDSSSETPFVFQRTSNVGFRGAYPPRR